METTYKSERAAHRAAFADHVYASSEPKPILKALLDASESFEDLERNTDPQTRNVSTETSHAFKQSEVLSRGASHALCSDCGLSEQASTHTPKETHGEECYICGKDSWTCEHYNDKPEMSVQLDGETKAERNI